METVLESLDVVLEVSTDPRRAAERAGLRYVNDDEPGYRRKPWGRGFTYLDPDGEHVSDDALRARFEALGIPPAWTDVWICADENGHLQATGRDERGRKQYRYHEAWQQVRSEAKFNRLIPFGEALGAIRARCERDLRRKGLPRDKVLAVVTCLLDRTLIRVGNPAYARQNGSFGLTTLRDRHVAFSPEGCTFEFVGKSGKKHCIGLDDPRLARLVRRCRDVPGYHLFQYYDEAGRRGEIGAADVNAYLKDTTGQEFTAKDFRTWGATVHAAVTLAEQAELCEDEREAEARLTAMIKTVAERLGNTPAVCRTYYVHPALPDAYRDGALHEAWPRLLHRTPPAHLTPEENALLAFLEERVFGDG